MSLCDSGDLLVCQRLLPMISHFAGGARVTMYSVLYSLHHEDEEEEKEEGTGTYLKVHKEIEEGYAEVCRLVKSRAGPDGRIAAIMGDSAGGHLSMCLALQLLHRNADHVRILFYCSYYCLPAFSETTWHESNHPINHQSGQISLYQPYRYQLSG